MLWVVSYDIPNDKRRAKIAKLLEGYGVRAQYSVFECDLPDTKRRALQHQLKKLIDEGEDDVRIYPLNRADVARVVVMGKGTVHKAAPVHFVGQREDDHPF